MMLEHFQNSQNSLFALKISEWLWSYKKESNYWGLRKNTTISHRKSHKKLIEQSKEIKQNWKGSNNFDICFYINFSCYDQSLISGSVTVHYVLPPTNFCVFLKCYSFLRSWVLTSLVTYEATLIQFKY